MVATRVSAIDKGCPTVSVVIIVPEYGVCVARGGRGATLADEAVGRPSSRFKMVSELEMDRKKDCRAQRMPIRQTMLRARNITEKKKRRNGSCSRVTLMCWLSEAQQQIANWPILTM